MNDAGVLNFDRIFMQEMIFNWICVAIVSVILYKLLYKPVCSRLKERADKISQEFTLARTELAEAAALKQECEHRLANLERERLQTLADASKRGREIEEILVKAAKVEAEKIKERAATDILLERAKASEEMKAEIIDISTLMARKIISDYTKDDVTALMLERSVEEVKCRI